MFIIDNQHFKVGNDKKGFNLVEEQIKKYATHVAHANKIKAFARSKGYIVKTDRIDSKIICEYAKAMGVSDDKFKF